jgi:UDP-N-acetylmuramoylalanine--D-glutamate ligase
MQGVTLKDQHVVSLGLGRQGVALARYLAQVGAEVTVSDLQGEETLTDQMQQLADIEREAGVSITYRLGDHPIHLLDDADLLCLSGGVPTDIPIVTEARKRGVPLSNDAQIFLDRCPAPVIGITGSAGKTTTTALVGEMCRAAGLRTWVGGNIGNPLIADLAVDSMSPPAGSGEASRDVRRGPTIGSDDCVVMELSSFQLELMTTSPHVAAVLNVTPNHLDRHKTMEAYVAAKTNIVAHQTEGDVALLGYDDANARALALETPAQLFFFSAGAEVEAGAFKTNGELTLRMTDRCRGQERDREICKASQVQLLGRHNLLNVLAASVLASLAGAPLEAIREVATTFTGVEHRLELVQALDGVRWYDDSIATAPERALAAMRSFEEPIVLLAGGRDKDLPWDAFAEETVRRVRQLVTFGEAGPMIAEIVGATMERNGASGADGQGVPNGSTQSPGSTRSPRLAGITRVETLQEAVEAAARLVEPGDVVLFSPGGTSFDAFKNFAERGERFKELVQELCGRE